MRHVEVVREGSRIEAILNRPDKRNALTGDMYVAMADALVEAEEAPEVLAFVIGGRGATFCAGADIVDFRTNPQGEADGPASRFLAAIASSSKVVIAAVHGAAVGVGSTMLLHCDHVVAADDATLRFAFVNLALVPEAASSLLLPAAVGRLKAAELMLTGDPLPATEALVLGLISRVVRTGSQLDAARAFAVRLDGLPPEALRATKRLLRSETAGISDRMAEESVIFRRRLASAEFREAASAFIEKRQPVFGR